MPLDYAHQSFARKVWRWMRTWGCWDICMLLLVLLRINSRFEVVHRPFECIQRPSPLMASLLEDMLLMVHHVGHLYLRWFSLRMNLDPDTNSHRLISQLLRVTLSHTLFVAKLALIQPKVALEASEAKEAQVRERAIAFWRRTCIELIRFSWMVTSEL